jgi:hypothetical protein
MFENRKYVIIPTSEVQNINFNQVLETSPETCRYSIDGMQTFVKYDGKMPSSIKVLVNKSKEYSHSEILHLLNGEDWTLLDELD